MALTGFKYKCGKNKGGVVSIAMTSAANVVAAEYDFALEAFSSIRLAENTGFAMYDFKEDDAIYTEVVKYDSGVVSIGHRLEFLLERMAPDSKKAVDEIMKTAREGVVAIITTAQGGRLLAGYSRKFGKERPLRPIQCIGTTGGNPEEVTGEKITLGSLDDAKAACFSGQIPVGA